MDASRKPPAPARAPEPRLSKAPGRALDERGRVVADEQAADSLKKRSA